MISTFFHGFTTIIKEVTFALAPLTVVFLLLQVFLLKLPKSQLKKILSGIMLTFIGLALFLQGVKIGFLPTGDLMGIKIGSLDYNWILIPIGFLLGFTVTLAEPAVRILNTQVEKVSGGYINKTVMLYTLSIGVGISVALSMVRVIWGISLWYFVVPGYIIALVLTRYISSEFVAIAFDAGGVATGPMTVTFILSMTVGVAKVLDGRNPLIDGFGMVSLVAMTPILAVLILGALYNRKGKGNESE